MDTLLVIDMQEGFRHPSSEAVISLIKYLSDRFDGEVIFCAFRNVPGSPFEQELSWSRFQSAEDRRLLKELGDRPTVQHTGYTALTPELRLDGTLYLCGVYTDVCVLKAAMDAFDHDIPVRVIADACASLHGERSHEAALDSLRHIIGRRNVILAGSVPRKDGK